METDPKRKLFKNVWFIFFAILSVSVVAYLWPSQEDRSFIYRLEGEVTVRLPGSESKWESAKKNDPMNPGSRIRTASNALAEVRLNDGSLLRIRPNTELEVISVFINPMMGIRNAQWRIITAGENGGVYVNAGKSGSVYEIQSKQFAAVVSAGSMRVYTDKSGNDVIKVIEPGSKAIALIGNEKHEIPPGNQAVIKNNSGILTIADKDELDEENSNLDKPILILSYQSPTINKSITVKGETGLRSTVFLDDRMITESDEYGNFKIEIALPVGKVEYKIAVADSANRRNEQVIQLERIGISDHALVVTSPKSGSTTTQDELEIIGTVQGSKKLTLEGKRIEYFGSSFEAKVKLKMGLNTFKLISTDAAGKTIEQTLWVTRDVDMPEASLDIYYPIGTITTREDKITIKGKTSARRVRIGTGQAVETSGSFSVTANLEPGRNAIVVSAEDESRKTTSKTVIVIREAPEAVRPEVKLNAYPAFTNNPSIAIKGTAINAVSLEIDGKRIEIEANGYFYRILDLAKDGKNSFDLVATSRDNVKTVILINIWRDNTPPDLSRIKAKKVKTNGYDEENKVLVVGVIEQNCDLYINGIKVDLIGSGDLRNVSHLLKDYMESTVTLKAVDKAGNQSARELKVEDPR